MRISLTQREDNIIISTVKPHCMAWYGEYETAMLIDGASWRILEGYNTKEDAIQGHEKYVNMSTEELENLPCIG